MVRVHNDFLELCCKPDGTRLAIRDKKRRVTWRLDDRTRRYHTGLRMQPLGRGTATALGPTAIRQEFDVEGERLSLLWELFEDGLKVTLSFEQGGGKLRSVALPGSFFPVDRSLCLALPIMQGVIFNGRGEPFERTLSYGGHEAFSMAMMGYLTDRAGLLISIESYTDWRAVIGKRDDGSIFAYPEQVASLGSMRYPRTACLFPTDAGLTALCKRYRRRVQERGNWKSWDEKIAERPSVERLFGALMAFIGYNQGEFDYVTECGKLLKRGFDRVFIYPVRFNTYSTDFKMGGDPPIHLSDDQILAIKGMGYEVAPWTWVVETLDDGSDEIRRILRRDPSGKAIQGWRIDEFQWYRCCTPFQVEFVKNAYRGPMRGMTWVHFDVNASIGPQECYALEHPHHLGYPLDRDTDLKFLRDLLGAETNGNRVVSSEGFRDCLADVYDIGTTKLLPAYGEEPFWTVPMTMLVYHDAVIHDWWELHNYNAHAGGFGSKSRFGRKGEGYPRDKAAMDALYGCPPNVFPFGRQYRWLDFAKRRTGSFSVRFEDSEVQEALDIALPVTKLHRRIGKLEMLSHEFLTEDGAVQATVFSDGTRVIANFSDEVRYVKEVGRMEPKSWRVI